MFSPAPGRSYRGALAPLSDIEEDIEHRLRNHVQIIAGEIGTRSLNDAPENLEKAATYIEQCFRAIGCPTTNQEFTVDLLEFASRAAIAGDITTSNAKHRVRNVIAELPGRDHADEIIVVGAHYDSVVDCPAANDNGSGAAAILEIARILYNSQPGRTIRFVAFPNEEAPFSRSEAMGSLRYARSCHERHEKIVAMMSLETMAYYSDEPKSQKHPHESFSLVYPNTGDFIAFVSNLDSRELLSRATTAFRNAVKFPSEGAALPDFVSGVDLSDHWSFWEYGYPAIMVTDTAFYRYPHYHTLEDTPDKLDYDRFARVVFGLSEVVRDLAR
jgi:Zn-dependent M28 family amino/carboxypeptidase